MICVRAGVGRSTRSATAWLTNRFDYLRPFMQNRSMRCLLLLVTALALTAAGEMALTVEKLTEFIRSAVQMKQPDKQVAETLRHFKMVEKLDDRTIEDLQSLGAGPKTVAALKELGTASASLAEAAPPAPKPVVVPLDPP